MSFCHHFASIVRVCKLFIFSSSLKPLNRLGPIFAKMFIWRSSTRSIILVQIGNPTWLPGPIMCSNWLKLWRPSCQKLLSPWNCNIIEMMTRWSSAKCVIFLAITYPRWPPQGNLVYHWTLWEFHWKTFLWETTQQIEYFALFECSLDGPIHDLLIWSRSEIARANNVLWLVETLKIFLSNDGIVTL